MNDSLVKNSNERDSLTIHEAATLLWEWRKYRNQWFWTSAYRWGAALLALTLTPYLLPDLIGKLGLAVFVFPVMVFLLSVFAAYLTGVEYKLYKQADRKFRSLLGKYTLPDFPTTRLVDRISVMSLGRVVPVAFLCLGVIVQFFNGWVLFYLVNAGV